ncbi:transcriptional regulator [Halogeometricum pallidum JCM 14848]|uniref:Transcriptional regulator n=1 Tax=Halogeometricum pallidum JCM 14848 TaxID=1227487 RepID=M0D2F8_HALPD|nr:AbrB/MazE/SpoVT family DNA-binding domain-containing protein [Halogeometricum pallidum]ELZ28998.1 transcriptional regulator [Halogeometricum pallidum JCM 14848]
MSTGDAETTVNESYSVTIPADVRKKLDLEPGDRLRWTTDDDGRLVAEIVRERYGAFDDFDPVDVGEETNAVDLVDEHGSG